MGTCIECGKRSVVRIDNDDLCADHSPVGPGRTIAQNPAIDAPGKFHKNAPDTERAAAFAVRPKTGTQRMKVLNAIIGSDGLTDPEVAELTGLYLYSAAPRRNELALGGWVEDSGARRETDNGGLAIVWIATAKAKALAS